VGCFLSLPPASRVRRDSSTKRWFLSEITCDLAFSPPFSPVHRSTLYTTDWWIGSGFAVTSHEMLLLGRSTVSVKRYSAVRVVDSLFQRGATQSAKQPRYDKAPHPQPREAHPSKQKQITRKAKGENK
jgi:hypothetical protein